MCVPPFLPLIERHTMFTGGSGYERSSCVHTHSAVAHTIVLGRPVPQGLKVHQILHWSLYKELSSIFRLNGQFIFAPFTSDKMLAITDGWC